MGKDGVNALWDGVDFDGQGNAAITINPGFSFPPDIGTATYQATCPELDSHPCVKIDFTAGSLPRFYYTRKVSSTTFLSFVHTQDGSEKYSDINVLELKPPTGKGVLNAAQVSSPATSPSSCADMNLEEVKDAAAAVDSANGFECFKNYFAALGRAQTEEELTLSLINTAGAYAGNMEWFDGPSSEKDSVNALWDGVDFDGHGNAAIT